MLELAKSYKEQGKTDKAKDAVKTLKNRVWNKAEPGYYYYDELMALVEELELE